MITLSKDYTIKFEPTNIILVKTGIKGAKAKNPGEKAEKIVGYFSDFEYLIEKLLNDKIIEFSRGRRIFYGNFSSMVFNFLNKSVVCSFMGSRTNITEFLHKLLFM